MSEYSIHSFDQIDSTNDYVKRNYLTLNHLSVVTSKIQTSGRGRSNHKWMSDEGNLYCSILIKDSLKYDDLFQELIHISTTLVRVLKSYGISAEIKYPNDILVNGKKIAGILIESSGSDEIDFIVIGFGLNINQLDFNNLNSKATSIRKLINNIYNVDEVLFNILEVFKENNHTFKEYVTYSMIIGKEITYNKQLYKVENILKDGRLLLKHDDIMLKVGINEISFEEIYK